MRNLFTHPRRLPLIAPSILSADFARMGEECRGVLSPPAEAAGPNRAGAADLLHLDVMDGHFVPNLTMGPDLCRCMRRACPDSFLDVHLMVTHPWPIARAFADAGANHITFHVEAAEAFPATKPGEPSGVREVADAIHQLGLTAGLSLNPPTLVERVEPYIEDVDLILVMSVSPGYSGQAFIPEALSKARHLSELLQPTQRLEMDGGIKVDNAGSVLDAGVDVVVAASAIFGLPASERPRVIAALRGK